MRRAQLIGKTRRTHAWQMALGPVIPVPTCLRRRKERTVIFLCDFLPVTVDAYSADLLTYRILKCITASSITGAVSRIYILRY